MHQEDCVRSDDAVESYLRLLSMDYGLKRAGPVDEERKEKWREASGGFKCVQESEQVDAGRGTGD